VGCLVVLAVAGVALATIGLSAGLLTLGAGSLALTTVVAGRTRAGAVGSPGIDPFPLYLIVVPSLTTLAQLALAGPLTSLSRAHAIASSAEFVDRIEAFRARQGHYPASLLAIWQDYSPDVVGIEGYHYASGDRSYNLCFEQPRFLLDEVGTREWVVYNPRDEHRMYSHTSWFLLLDPEELERSPGWYDVQETGRPHWRSSRFD
jgi:hypothetical protein